MKKLLDTHIILWAAFSPSRLSQGLISYLNDSSNEPYFSVASLWEIAIKNGLGKKEFQVDSRVLRRGLLDNGYYELPIKGEHVVFIESLPSLHKDPFDRILVAQSTVEGITLVTSDTQVAQYPGPIELI
ncbi:type II toxin-antitoxin system VapC family toxin [Fluoribacter gormanii]|uniref:type II toxin-antitoxin system VapC family toxin n=1 Tax=Fluoribacter gormanii TaxID=464 RepID=UPI001040F611|nr:type II toxin-antitoxin system VapC family toxin [Fluoribacter gormanii]